MSALDRAGREQSDPQEDKAREIDAQQPVHVPPQRLRFGITQKWLSNLKRNLLAPEFMYLNVDMALKAKGL